MILFAQFLSSTAHDQMILVMMQEQHNSNHWQSAKKEKNWSKIITLSRPSMQHKKSCTRVKCISDQPSSTAVGICCSLEALKKKWHTSKAQNSLLWIMEHYWINNGIFRHTANATTSESQNGCVKNLTKRTFIPTSKKYFLVLLHYNYMPQKLLVIIHIVKALKSRHPRLQITL